VEIFNPIDTIAELAETSVHRVNCVAAVYVQNAPVHLLHVQGLKQMKNFVELVILHVEMTIFAALEHVFPWTTQIVENVETRVLELTSLDHSILLQETCTDVMYSTH
jgi:hypothetical protein